MCLVLAAVLLASCPSLAARHVVRARQLAARNGGGPALDTDATHCTNCGTYLLDGHGGSVSLTRRRRKHNNNNTSPSRMTVLQRVCHVCGRRQLIPLSRGNAVLFPRRRPQRYPQPPISDHIAGDRLPSQEPQTLPDTTQDASHAEPTRPKPRRANKSALQVMLARHRDKERIDRDAKSHQSSSSRLAAFLEGL